MTLYDNNIKLKISIVHIYEFMIVLFACVFDRTDKLMKTYFSKGVLERQVIDLTTENENVRSPFHNHL